MEILVVITPVFVALISALSSITVAKINTLEKTVKNISVDALQESVETLSHKVDDLAQVSQDTSIVVSVILSRLNKEEIFPRIS